MRNPMIILLSALVSIAGCSSKPVLPYEDSRPAQILTPVSHAGIVDGRARFREIFCERYEFHGGFEQPCEGYLHELDDEPTSVLEAPGPRLALEQLRIFIVPGYLGGSTPNDMKPFGVSVETLRAQGYNIEYIMVSGGGSSEYNAAIIAEALAAVETTNDETIVLIGYSKGTTDILHFLVGHPEEAGIVDAVISFAGAVNGSPIADVFPEFLVNFVASFDDDVGDKGGLDSIKRSVQMRWLAAHPLPPEPKYFSVATFTDPENVSAMLASSYNTLAEIDPRNDGQVIFYDQLIPHSALLGYANSDHWAIALPFTEEAKSYAATLMNHNEFPRLAFFESVLLYVRENL